MPCDPSVCLASFSVPPAPFLSISVPLSLPIFPICLTPLYQKKSQRLKALCASCSALWFPSFPHFPLSFSLPCVVSCCTTEILFLCFPSSLILSVSGFYYMHTCFTSKHCHSIPLNSSHSMSLCYFLGRGMCPGAVFQRCQ